MESSFGGYSNEDLGYNEDPCKGCNYTGDQCLGCECNTFTNKVKTREELMEHIKTQEGRKLDQGKTRYDLIHTGSLKDLADVLTFGSKKYDDDNWMKVDAWKRRYYSAAMRHLQSWYSGDTLDEETGLPHLAHAMCCLMFLNELTKKDIDKDSTPFEVGTCDTCSNNYSCADYLRNADESRVCFAYKKQGES